MDNKKSLFEKVVELILFCIIIIISLIIIDKTTNIFHPKVFNPNDYLYMKVDEHTYRIYRKEDFFGEYYLY